MSPLAPTLQPRRRRADSGDATVSFGGRPLCSTAAPRNKLSHRSLSVLSRMSTPHRMSWAVVPA
jgi:hypothetical protein